MHCSMDSIAAFQRAIYMYLNLSETKRICTRTQCLCQIIAACCVHTLPSASAMFIVHSAFVCLESVRLRFKLLKKCVTPPGMRYKANDYAQLLLLLLLLLLQPCWLCTLCTMWSEAFFCVRQANLVVGCFCFFFCKWYVLNNQLSELLMLIQPKTWSANIHTMHVWRMSNTKIRSSNRNILSFLYMVFVFILLYQRIDRILGSIELWWISCDHIEHVPRKCTCRM